MVKSKIVWIDDDWAVTSDGTSQMRRRFEDSIKQIDAKLKPVCDLEWVRVAEVSSGIVELVVVPDVQLTIVDIHFTKAERYGHDSVIARCEELKIPYLIFSNVAAKYNQDFERSSCIAVLEKDADGFDSLANAIVNFFSHIPFRILHLSDLHFNSRQDRALLKAQNAMLDKLCATLSDYSLRNPFDAVVATGDFASHNPKDDLPLFENKLRAIIEASVGLRNIDRFFMIPGNHDLTWDDFNGKVLTNEPWRDYMRFCQSIFSPFQAGLECMRAWHGSGGFDYNSRSEDLCWRRIIKQPNLDIIGVCSASLETEKQGMGMLSEASLDFISDAWREHKHGSFRIALIHHNIFPVFSTSSIDEKYNILNSGDVVATLVSRGCDLVLSGHTHFSSYGRISYSNQDLTGFDRLLDLTMISTGTAGGEAPGRDRPKKFNIMEFAHFNPETKSRSLSIIPYLYDSSSMMWKSFRTLDTFI